jgi:ASCH domain
VVKSGLIIREPWIDLILNGAKTWEMRSEATNVRGSIALIKRGTGLVVGTARLVESRPPLTRENYMSYRDKHAIPTSMLEEVLANGWTYPWVLSEVRHLPRPVSYRHKQGAVKFVTLDEAAIAAIARQEGGERDCEHDRRGTQEGPAQVSAPPPRATSIAANIRAETARGSPSEPVFVFRPEKAQAYGRLLANREFLVLAGSTAMRRGSPNVKRDAHDRDRLVREGVLVPDKDVDLYRFHSDWRFSSCSKAAGVIKDGNASGTSLWKEMNTGMSLKDYFERNR